MNSEILQLVIIVVLAIVNVWGAWYLNRLWSKEKSQRKENSSFERSR